MLPAALTALLYNLSHLPGRRAEAGLALACAAGLAAAYLALHLRHDTYPESGLLRAMTALPVTAALLLALTDRRHRRPGIALATATAATTADATADAAGD
ncbi:MULTISPECIES: hypothetical protein [Kitasatospora]|uniref:hypothetical protein n=1 Tax=Kitasatospora TaxID=2063 RepID=UPI000301CAC6|nr:MULTISPECIES: hypothetical protein [Kitasatospora]